MREIVCNGMVEIVSAICDKNKVVRSAANPNIVKFVIREFDEHGRPHAHADVPRMGGSIYAVFSDGMRRAALHELVRVTVHDLAPALPNPPTVITAEPKLLSSGEQPKNCLACAHCFCEPDDDFVCGHPDAGPAGSYVRRAATSGGHCGPMLPKFEQHPLRTPSGSLKTQG